MEEPATRRRPRLGEGYRWFVTSLAWLWTAGCLAVMAANGLRFLDDTLPYVQHIDERTLMRGAKRVVQESGLNPRIYNYPSLPFYLTAAGLTKGTLDASSQGPEHVTVQMLGRVEPPYYERLAVGAGPRKLWLGLGLACTAATIALGFVLGGPAVMALTASLLALTGIPVHTAREYLNVDTPLALFSVLLLFHLIRVHDRTNYRDRVWIPALFCGAAMASKYTGVVALVPAVLAIWLAGGASRTARSFELAALSCLVFLLLCPRVVLDFPSFVDALSYESYHYRFKGHKRFTLEPGWDQVVAYGKDIAAAYGGGLIVAAVAGSAAWARAAPTRSAILASFAMCWFAMLIDVKVHFVRNLLPLLLCVAVLASYGILAIWTWSGAWLSRVRVLASPLRTLAVRLVVLAAVIAATLPFARLREAHERPIDSRIRLVRWAEKGLPDRAVLVVPDALPFSTETAPPSIAVERVDLRDAAATANAARPGAFMVVPNWTDDSGGVAARVAELAPGMHALPPYQVIREFSGAPAVPGMERELSVNPAFRVVRFKP